MKKCLKLTIIGLVQGIGLRTHIQTTADKIGDIEGTAQNMPDGSIIIQISGPADKIDSLVDEIYKGTSKSKIENIETEALRNPKDFRGVFRIIG